jgi:hypothetical protein
MKIAPPYTTTLPPMISADSAISSPLVIGVTLHIDDLHLFVRHLD